MLLLVVQYSSIRLCFSLRLTDERATTLLRVGGAADHYIRRLLHIVGVCIGGLGSRPAGGETCIHGLIALLVIAGHCIWRPTFVLVVAGPRNCGFLCLPPNAANTSELREIQVLGFWRYDARSDPFPLLPGDGEP